MRIDRGVPALGQVLERSDVVEMAMRHHDRSRTCLRAETFISAVHNQMSRSGNTGVDQHPISVTCARTAVIHDIDDGKSAISEERCDLMDRLIAISVDREGGRGKGDLLVHLRKDRFAPPALHGEFLIADTEYPGDTSVPGDSGNTRKTAETLLNE